MPIDNISRIDTKGEKSVKYVFDLPSIEDDEAIISYYLETYKDGNIKISKLTDYNDLFQKLHVSKTIPIKYQSREYKLFISKMAEYLNRIKEQNNEDKSLNDEDIDMIETQYFRELHKKGNTEVLKRWLKK